MALVWTDVTSSQLSKIGYDEETQEAQVRFSNGSLYSYKSVPKEVVDGIVDAKSVGRAFNNSLKYGFEYTKLE